MTAESTLKRQAEHQGRSEPGSLLPRPADPEPTVRRLLRDAWEKCRPFAYVAPGVFLLVVFLGILILLIVGLSFFKWNLISEPSFVGFINYGSLADHAFYQLLWHTVEYILLALMGNFVFPLILAGLTLQVGHRLAAAYQAVLFAPTMIATAVAALVWQYLLLPGGGPLSTLLAGLSIPPHDWLNSPQTSLVTISIIAAWKSFGFNFVVALAGLTALPRPLMEAARMDGAGGLRLLRFITLPLLAPTISFLLLTTVLQAIPSVFVLIQILTQGGPAGASNNLLYEIYLQAFQFMSVGSASAQAVVLLIGLTIAAACQLFMMRRWAQT